LKQQIRGSQSTRICRPPASRNRQRPDPFSNILDDVRKHGGRQEGGWSFDLKHLHAKSGSLSPLKHFAYDLREIVRREWLPGYPAGH
jgi:plasmid replication initiation protein